MNTLINPIDLAWCAGLFEGEGTIFLANQKRNNGKTYTYFRAAIKMTDLDVLEKFQSIVGCGTIIKQTQKSINKQPKNWKQHYYWQVTKEDDVRQLMLLFWNFLGSRRRLKIVEIGLISI